jgi:hypothetical protein
LISIIIKNSIHLENHIKKMKYLLLAGLIALGMSADNDIKGPGNVVVNGKDNHINGKFNLLDGFKNLVKGDFNDIEGDKNNVKGDKN